MRRRRNRSAVAVFDVLPWWSPLAAMVLVLTLGWLAMPHVASIASRDPLLHVLQTAIKNGALKHLAVVLVLLSVLSSAVA